MVEVRELCFSYGAHKAVDGLSFTVQSGEVFGLLGPNGAGKTTTFLLLSGVFSPDRGEVRVCGANPQLPSSRRLFGHAPQAIALYDGLSAEENLRFWGRLYGLQGKRLHARVEFCLDVAGLAPRRRQRVGSFSAGMKKRLNVAASILHDPKVVLLDEPTAGVDPQSRANLFAMIAQLKAEGKAVLFASHVLAEAEALCDRVVILDRGRTVAEGSLRELLATYGGPFTITGEAEEKSPRPELPGLGWEGSRFRLVAAHPGQALQQLEEAGVLVRHLELRSASLEEVFLRLTGREVRDP
ncbi:MAG: ATP-binding cassette domain-containing protein [Thermoanaerobaculum sp.]